MEHSSVPAYAVSRGDRSVPLAHQTDEEWSAALNLVQADVEHFALFSFLFGHAPSQVDIDQMQAAACTALS